MSTKIVQIPYETNELKILQDLKEYFNEKTDSKAVKSASRSFLKINNEKEHYFEKLTKLQGNYDRLIDLCNTFIESKQEIKDLIEFSKRN